MLGQGVLMAANSIFFAPIAVWMVQTFTDPRCRYSAMGIGYNLSQCCFGGTAGPLCYYCRAAGHVGCFCGETGHLSCFRFQARLSLVVISRPITHTGHVKHKGTMMNDWFVLWMRS